MNTIVTIADIARKAGVGTATVDRVLNRRPGVNEETFNKVIEVVNSIGEPTVMRGRPRRKSNYRFAFVLPQKGPYFTDDLERQIAQSAGDFRHKNIAELTMRLDNDPNNFAEQLSKINDCDAIALLAPDTPSIKLAINEKVREGVQVVTIFSDIPGSMRALHIGADNRAAGRTAALLLARMYRSDETANVLLISQSTRYTAEIERRIGFSQVIEERFPHVKVHRIPDISVDPLEIQDQLVGYLKTFEKTEKLSGAYSVGVGTRAIVNALNEYKSIENFMPLIVHDSTELHQALLLKDQISYVIKQDIHYCFMTATRVLHGLCENVRGALNVAQPRVEILTAENLY